MVTLLGVRDSTCVYVGVGVLKGEGRATHTQIRCGVHDGQYIACAYMYVPLCMHESVHASIYMRVYMRVHTLGTYTLHMIYLTYLDLSVDHDLYHISTVWLLRSMWHRFNDESCGWAIYNNSTFWGVGMFRGGRVY